MRCKMTNSKAKANSADAAVTTNAAAPLQVLVM
jgi:hypothetical protein